MSSEANYDPDMPSRSILGRVINITLQPSYEWGVISREDRSSSEVFAEFFIPISFIFGIISVLYEIIFVYDNVYQAAWGSYTIGFISIFIARSLQAIALFYMVFFILRKISPNFGGAGDQNECRLISCYGIFPALLAISIDKMIGNLFFNKSYLIENFTSPVMFFLFLLIIYSCYVIYRGSQKFLCVPQNRSTSFGVALSVSVLLSVFAVGYAYNVTDKYMQEYGMVPDRAYLAAKQDDLIRGMHENLRSLERWERSPNRRY